MSSRYTNVIDVPAPPSAALANWWHSRQQEGARMDGVERFVDAQAQDLEAAIGELRAGRKQGHWIWYVFPQLAGLGTSAMSRRFALAGREEAEDYLQHAGLRDGYARAVDAVADHMCRLHPPRLDELMGGQIDAVKLVSSLTLFESVAEGLAVRTGDSRMASLAERIGEVLAHAESQGYERCAFTLTQLAEG
jgi:uncharacterized protein (DUF1810 family)